jgi:hypothetical protein
MSLSKTILGRFDTRTLINFQHQVWRQICFHINGMAIGSTVGALHEAGVLRLLQAGPLSMGDLLQQIPAHPGYLHLALRLLASQGWLVRDRAEASDMMRFELTTRGRHFMAYVEGYSHCLALLRAADNIDAYLFGRGVQTYTIVEEDTDALLIRSATGWELPRMASAEAEAGRNEVIDHLDGHLLAASLMALTQRRLLPEATAVTAVIHLDTIASHHNHLAPLHRVCDLMARHGWLMRHGDDVTFLPEGIIAACLAPQYWYPLSYLSTLRRVPDLLFGNASALHQRDAQGDEQHIDRALDIQFSGKVFSTTCREPFMRMLLPIFDRCPIASQPCYIIDIGSGDGSLLKETYKAIRTQSVRGRNLDSSPLEMIGIEPNRIAREATSRTLDAAGIPHRTFSGDIDDPAGLEQQLAKVGIDARMALYVTKSVIHNRSYHPPLNPLGAAHRVSRSHTVFVAPDGALIPHRDLEQNLVEFFQRWKPLAAQHGMVIIEAHTAEPASIARNVTRTIATAMDATHGYSNQYLVDPLTFEAAAREAGFTSTNHHAIGESRVGHTVLTIDRFVVTDPSARIPT